MFQVVCFMLFSSSLVFSSSAPSNVYHQIIPLMTKKINPEKPTESNQILLNSASAFMIHGTNHSSVNAEIIKAIASVDYFTDILPQYLKTNTVSGQIQAALLTSQMTDDLSELQYRQSIVKYFNNHKDVAKQLQSTLAQTTAAEAKFFGMFQSMSQEMLDACKKTDEKLFFTSKEFDYLNNKYFLEISKRSKQLTVATFIAMAIGCNYNTYKCLSFKGFNNEQDMLLSFYGIYLAILTPLMIKETANEFSLIQEKQKHLISIATLIKNIQTLCDVIEKNEELAKMFCKELEKMKSMVNPNNKETSSNFKYLISELTSSSFQGDSSYYFSKQGKILTTAYFLNKCRGELVPFLEALGTVDAYLSASMLYQEFQNHPRAQFCVPTFVDSSTPVMEATEYWHPLISPNCVVTNSLKMGAGAKNLMITGPNAGGKTTSLMSLVINIIMAQSLGIAPSKELTLTPFAKIHSYLDITTNLQEGLSLFAAEVDRAKKLKTSITSCTPGQKTFTIIDEIFSGTNPQVASDVGSKFAQQLGEMGHSMTIITTHFPKLTELEKTSGTFINYKVADATIMPDGKIVYPFKLVRGISTQNIAQHMLEHEGII